MREHYDFSKMKGRKNPDTKQLKQPVTMRLDKTTVATFKSLAEELGIRATIDIDVVAALRREHIEPLVSRLHGAYYIEAD